MNIALVTIHVRRSRQAVPLASACLAAGLPKNLRERTDLVELFPDQSEEEMLSRILAGQPEMVSFTLYSWNRPLAVRLAAALRRTRPGLVLIAGGPEASADAFGVLGAKAFDGAIRGEGEAVFAKLATSLEAGQRPEDLPGVLWHGTPQEDTDPVEPPLPPEALPSPWLSGVLKPEFDGGVLWETSRGCPFACDYCFDAGGHSGVRHLPLSRLRAELKLFTDAGVSQVWVLDSTFNFPPKHGKDLLRLIRETAPYIHFHLEAKAEFLDPELIALLTQVDCSVQIGLQSIHPEVLHHIGRGFDPEDFRRKGLKLSAEGIVFGLDLIYGLPGDTHNGFRQSLDAALSLSPNHLDIFRLAVLPGTALHRRRHELGIIAQDTPPYAIVASSSYSRDDLAQSELLAAATRIFYNTGRSVGFFLALTETAGQKPVDFLETFLDWLLRQRKIPEEKVLDVDRWNPAQVLELQKDFTQQILARRKTNLIAATHDLLHYHYHYAESLLGPEVLPAEPEELRGMDLLKTPWRVNPHLRLVPFAYEVADLLEIGASDPRQIVRLFQPVGSVALFLRRGPQVACESLEENFCRLLRESDGRTTPSEIFAGTVDPDEVEEWVDFAVAEGLLLPPSP